MLKKIFIPLAVVAGAALLAFFIANAKPEVERQAAEVPLPLITVIEAQPSDVSLDVASQGTVEPRTESTLVAQIAGRILSVSQNFAEGAFVAKGQILMRLDPADFELAVEQAQAQVAAAEVRLRLEEAEAELALQEWQDLAPDKEPTALAAREPQVREARAALEGARASLSQAQLNLSRTTIEAPFTGRVRTKQADLGQFVSPGTPLATLFATDWAEIRLPVPKDQLAYLELDDDWGGSNLDGKGLDGKGPEVRLSAEIGGATRRWQARVVRTGGVIDSRTRMLDLFARVEDPYGRNRSTKARGDGWTALPIGLFVEAEIAGKVAHGAFEVPRAALRSDGRLMVIDAEDRLRFREIQPIRIQGETAVVGSGLEPGDRIPVSPLETPVEGMKVRTTLETRTDAPRTTSTPEATL